MVAVAFQHSEPYRSTLRTLLLKICILVRILMIVDLQTGLSPAKAWFAWLILMSISLSQSPDAVTLLPRYANSSTFSSGLPSILMGSLLFEFSCKTCVFLALTLRPKYWLL